MTVRKAIRFLWIPAVCFFGYFLTGVLLSYGFSYLPVSPVWSSFVLDTLGIVVFGFAYSRLVLRDCEPVSFPGFSGLGVFLTLLVFLTLFVFSQTCASAFSHWFPVSYDAVYTDMSDQDVILYSLFSVTVAPIAEEFLFRGVFYRYLRKHFGKLFSFCVSAVPFCLIHGTVMHIPVTFGVSLLGCILIELTGKLRWSIFAHILYNLLGVSYLISVQWSSWTAVVGFLLTMVFLTIVFARTEYFRKFLERNGVRSLESVLDEKRRKLLEDANENHHSGPSERL